MCRGFIAEQRALLRAGDANALGKRTIDEYAICLERNVLPVMGELDPAALKSTQIAQYLATRRKGNPATGKKPAPTGANRDIAALASAFSYGIRESMAEGNPCKGVRRNKERPRSRKVSRTEFNAFMAMAKDQTPALYMAALIGATVAISGRRRAELLGLTKNALTADGIETTASKVKAGQVGKDYLVKWSPLLAQILAEAKRVRPLNSRYLFPNSLRACYTDPGFKCTWHKLMKVWVGNGGEHFTAHDMRAFYVTEMLAEDRAPNTHANPATMLRVYNRRKVVDVTPLA